MRFERAHVVVFLSLLISLPLTAQQSSSPSISAATLFQQSLIAQVGNTSISDITLTGTARRIAGSSDESGSATFQASANGSARLTLNFPSGNTTEVANLFSTPSGTWSGPDSLSHSISFYNLITEPAWFSPSIALARRVSLTNYVATYVGHETLNGEAVEHVSVSQLGADPPGGPTFAHLTQVDFYLDSTTLLPAALSFNVHPDNSANLDIPVQVFFSDYRSVSGIRVPFHVQKYLNNSPFLDLQIQSVTSNSGLTASAFTTN